MKHPERLLILLVVIFGLSYIIFGAGFDIPLLNDDLEYVLAVFTFFIIIMLSIRLIDF